MIIERENNQMKLSFSDNILGRSELQSIIDLVKFREINAASKANQEDADKLADEINQSWWEKNKHRFE